MIEVIKVLLNALNEYEIHPDELPLGHDFKEVGMFYMVETAQDEEGNFDYDVQIHFVHETKLKILNLVDIIDKKLNDKTIDGIRILRKNVYLNHFYDEGKHTYILEYYFRKFKQNGGYEDEK